MPGVLFLICNVINFSEDFTTEGAEDREKSY